MSESVKRAIGHIHPEIFLHAPEPRYYVILGTLWTEVVFCTGSWFCCIL
jgi:hypothetical protein